MCTADADVVFTNGRVHTVAGPSPWAEAHPDGVVRGFGWRVDMFGPDGPSRADLDRVPPGLSVATPR